MTNFSCSLETESMLFSTLLSYTTLHRVLITELRNINDALIMSLNENDLFFVTKNVNKNFDKNMNISILTGSIELIKDSERFDQPCFHYY